MRMCFLFVLLAAMSLVASPQTQHGVVKTRGRMVNGKLVPGEKVPSAVVSVRGRSAILSGTDGSFSFTVSGNSFIVDSVRKKDYALIDMEACRQYKFPQSPFVLLMEKPEVQQAELLARERSLRRDLQKRLQQREDEVDALNVSLEEKNRLLAEINHDREENEKLIKDLAEYYAKLDYDRLDEFQRRVSECLENGELERADSLLRSRGDMNSRIAEIHAEEAAEAKEDEAIAKRQGNNQNAKEGTKKKKELAATDCYSFHQRFAQAHQRDSAAYYLELRASLDTTNVEWANETGQYINDYLADYSKALEYYQLLLRQSLLQYGEQDEWTATAYDNIGYNNDRQGNYTEALEYCTKALAIREKVLGKEHPDVATSYNNIGSIYYDQGDYSKALEYLTKAPEIQEKVLGAEHPDVALSYNNTGIVYKNLGKYPEALEYLTKALEIQKKVLGKEHPDVAQSYNNIGLVYSAQGDYPKALEYFTQGLEIWEKVLGAKHPNVALSYNNISEIYTNQGNYPKALEYHTKALGIRKKVLGREHPDVAQSYNNIGHVYLKQCNYSEALEYFAKALEIWEKVLSPKHPYVATSYNNIGVVYYNQANYSKALEYYTKALEIWEKVLGSGHPNTKLIKENIEKLKAKMITQDSVAMQEYVFMATVDDDDTPASQQGMTGEYIILEFADWTINESSSLFDKNNEMRGKPKDIVVMKDGTISQHHFENIIGVQFGLKQVGKEEKNRIIKAYEKWKAKNNN